MKINNSLANFRKTRQKFLVGAVVTFVLGILFLIFGMSATTTSTGDSSWYSPSDTSYTSYASESDCSADGWTDCTTDSTSTTTPSPNASVVSLGIWLEGLAGGFVTLAVISSFLIATAESIVEGMNGNIVTELPQPAASISDQ